MMWYTLPPSKYSALEGWESRKVGHRVCPIRWGTHSSLWLSVHCPNSWGTHSSLCLSTVPFAEGQLPLSVCLSVCPQFACPLVSFRARVPPPKHTPHSLLSPADKGGERDTERDGGREGNILKCHMTARIPCLCNLAALWASFWNNSSQQQLLMTETDS